MRLLPPGGSFGKYILLMGLVVLLVAITLQSRRLFASARLFASLIGTSESGAQPILENQVGQYPVWNWALCPGSRTTNSILKILRAAIRHDRAPNGDESYEYISRMLLDTNNSPEVREAAMNCLVDMRERPLRRAKTLAETIRKEPRGSKLRRQCMEGLWHLGPHIQDESLVREYWRWHAEEYPDLPVMGSKQRGSSLPQSNGQ